MVGAQGKDRRHVHLVEGGQHGRFVLGGDQAFGHLSAQHGQFGTALPTVPPCGGAHGGDGLYGILFGDAAIPSASRDLGGRDALFLQYLFGRRGRAARGVAFFLGHFLHGDRFFGGILFWGLLFWFLLFWFLLFGLPFGGIPIGLRGRGVDQADNGTYCHGIPYLRLEGDDTTGLCGKFQGRL